MSGGHRSSRPVLVLRTPDANMKSAVARPPTKAASCAHEKGCAPTKKAGSGSYNVPHTIPMQSFGLGRSHHPVAIAPIKIAEAPTNQARSWIGPRLIMSQSRWVSIGSVGSALPPILPLRVINDPPPRSPGRLGGSPGPLGAGRRIKWRSGPHARRCTKMPPKTSTKPMSAVTSGFQLVSAVITMPMPRTPKPAIMSPKPHRWTFTAQAFHCGRGCQGLGRFEPTHHRIASACQPICGVACQDLKERRARG